MRLKYFWHVVMPCLPLFLYNTLNAIGVFGEATGGPPRALSISIAITFYYLFSETLIGFSSALELNKNYIVKTGVSFRACYLSAVMTVYSNFFIRLVVVVLLLIIYQSYSTISVFLALVYSVVPIAIGISVGLLLSIFTVFYRDIENIVQTIAFYFLFASGVFGVIDGTSVLEKVVSNTPTYVAVSNAKNLLLDADSFQFKIVAFWLLIAVMLIALSVVAIKNSASLVRNYLR